MGLGLGMDGVGGNRSIAEAFDPMNALMPSAPGNSLASTASVLKNEASAASRFHASAGTSMPDGSVDTVAVDKDGSKQATPKASALSQQRQNLSMASGDQSIHSEEGEIEGNYSSGGQSGDQNRSTASGLTSQPGGSRGMTGYRTVISAGPGSRSSSRTAGWRKYGQKKLNNNMVRARPPHSHCAN